MGIRTGNFKLVYNSFTMETIDPSYLGISKKQITDYLKKHSMPDDPEYSVEDMVGDISESSGFYCLPDKVKDETANFVATLISDLM